MRTGRTPFLIGQMKPYLTSNPTKANHFFKFPKINGWGKPFHVGHDPIDQRNYRIISGKHQMSDIPVSATHT
jgi:hypothetical protein